MSGGTVINKWGSPSEQVGGPELIGVGHGVNKWEARIENVRD